MAFRNPGIDVMSHTVEDPSTYEDNWITYKPDDSDIDEPTESSDAETKSNKVCPALTNFSLATLSTYLYEKLKENRLEEEQLKSDPQLAALEVEKKELRKIVNSNRPIEARVQNGRLHVRTQTIGSRGRSNSAPPSEGDNEMYTKKFENGSGSMKGKGAVTNEPRIVRQRKQSTNLFSSFQHKSRHEPVRIISNPTDDPMEGPSRRGAQDSEDDGNHDNDDSFHLDRPSMLRRSPGLQEGLAAQSQSLVPSPTDGPSTRLRRNSSKMYAYELNPVGRDEIESTNEWPKLARNQRRQPTSVQDVSNIGFTTNARGRSLSFEKHADELRQSVRSSKAQVKKAVELQNNSEDDDSSRPRKLASSIEDSRPDLEAFGFNSQVNSVVKNATSATKFDTFKSWTHQPSIVDRLLFADVNDPDNIEHGVSHTTVEPDVEVGADNPGNLSDTVMANGLFDDLKFAGSTILSEKRKVLTGKDTFYSASSEETTSASEKESDITIERSRHGNGKGKDKLVEWHEQEGINDTPLMTVPDFNYNAIMPEKLPSNIRQARDNCQSIWSLVGLDDKGQVIPDRSDSWYATQYSVKELSPDGQNILGAPNSAGQFPRVWNNNSLPVSPKEPPTCIPASQIDHFPPEILPLVCYYLSSREVRNLRLVNRATASALLPLVIRNSVFKFGRSLFDATDEDDWDGRSETPAPSSLLQTYGGDINRFGVSFEVSLAGLARSRMKVIEEEVTAWFGKYTWPKERYPRFSELKELEDLVDGHRLLLKNAMKNLTNVSELGLSLDSGHGWLNGPDISDMALIREKSQGGTKIFGRTFDAPDALDEFALRQFFRWGQLNTINANSKRLGHQRSRSGRIGRKTIRRYRVREYDDYMVQVQQLDFNRSAHTGGDTLPTLQQPAAGAAALVAHPLPPIQAHLPQALPPVPPLTQSLVPSTVSNQTHNHQTNWFTTPPTMSPNGPVYTNFLLQGPTPTWNTTIFPPVLSFNRRSMRMRQQRSLAKDVNEEMRSSPIIPQWPLIFNGLNLAAQMGGNHSCVQSGVFAPTLFPYLPGELTENQVQWLMETLWAQRAFLSAYTNSIITNAGVFKNVHSLNIAKISSGLLPSLASDEFWSSLTELKKLTLKVIPDWRQEHVPGDKYYYRNMLISPVQSASKLAHLLKSHISKLENLSTLTTGFVGGGEHQSGLFARNCNVLPAPIVSDINTWFSDHESKPDARTMFAFNHIRDLTFENCWFSPCMLEAFMIKSRDTSLHHLTLDSVSLTGLHDARNDGPVTTESHNLSCQFCPGEWLQETVPRNACWVNVLESITPGKTILQRRYDAEMINEEANPRPSLQFRGNIKKITLSSCGYVKISGVRADLFSQNGLVQQSNPACAVDEGLAARKQSFYVTKSYDTRTNSTTDRLARNMPFRRRISETAKEVCVTSIMMSTKEPDGSSDYVGLGRLTQAVHPIEKRILERAWGMRFGWGDTMDRWGAVEDGWFEGGTGRFSGTIEREDDE